MSWGWQLTTKRYVPFVYWLTVVVVSVTGTLYTDILTDSQGVPLALSSSVFACILAVVGIWYARERTLSVHTITTCPRELFYWLAVLVTFALDATGDWTLELTGWTPGVSGVLPLGLIGVIVLAWRLGANAVLSFWLAYILTRPLGANLGLRRPRLAQRRRRTGPGHRGDQRDLPGGDPRHGRVPHAQPQRCHRGRRPHPTPTER